MYTCPSPPGINQPISIMYVTAEDVKQKNMVQFIWSVYETPSIIVAYTSKKNSNSNWGIDINCANLLNGSSRAISFLTKYDYIIAFEISELHEFSDPDDKVLFSTKDFKNYKHNISETYWNYVHEEENNVTTFYGGFLNGNISFKVRIF
jgi:hypothetical protein